MHKLLNILNKYYSRKYNIEINKFPFFKFLCLTKKDSQRSNFLLLLFRKSTSNFPKPLTEKNHISHSCIPPHYKNYPPFKNNWTDIQINFPTHKFTGLGVPSTTNKWREMRIIKSIMVTESWQKRKKVKFKTNSNWISISKFIIKKIL